MLPLGHIGLGYGVVRVIARKNSDLLKPLDRHRWLAFAAGVWVPDIIDKLTYYGASWWTGLRGPELGMLSGTRLFAHSVPLWCLVFWLLSRRFRSRDARSLLVLAAAGVFSHLALDHIGDAIRMFSTERDRFYADFTFVSTRFRGLVFPFMGPHFPVNLFVDAKEHFEARMNPFSLGFEISGFLMCIVSVMKGWWRWSRAHRPSHPS